MENIHIGIIGLGYVGLPLAVEFGKKYKTLGYDIDPARLAELRQGNDSTLEVDEVDLALSTYLHFSSAASDLNACNVFVGIIKYKIRKIYSIKYS